jgi:L-threonylcarbamoyladenylate synthase
MNEGDALAFEQCIAAGGVAIFPTDTVYGIGCDPSDGAAVRRIQLLKGRSPDKQMAVMYFSIERALDDLAELGPNTERALRSLLPGPVTAIVRSGGESRGVRVPRLEGPLGPLSVVRCGVLQTSANESGGADPRRLDEVPREIREAVNLQLDGGVLAGTASTVIDLTAYEQSGNYEVLREGALPGEAVASLLG